MLRVRGVALGVIFNKVSRGEVLSDGLQWDTFGALSTENGPGREDGSGMRRMARGITVVVSAA